MNSNQASQVYIRSWV